MPDWVESKLQDWTPTVDQNGSVSVTVDYAKYQKVGIVVTLLVDLTVTGSGSAGNPIEVESLPFPIAHTAGRVAMGSALIVDADTNTYGAIVDNFGSDILRFIDPSTTDWVGQNPNFALANTDTISFVAIYEDGT